MYFKSKLKGFIGEKKVKILLKKYKKPLNAKILNNVKLNVNGKTHQIDHVYITSKNIYVIETKNYNGTLYGKPGEYYWTNYYSHKQKYKIENPIIQNYNHLKIIEFILNKPLLPIRNIVIFTGNANIEHIKTTQTKTLIEFEDILNQEMKCISLDFLNISINTQTIYNLIKSNQSSFTKKQHILNIQNRSKKKYYKF